MRTSLDEKFLIWLVAAAMIWVLFVLPSYYQDPSHPIIAADSVTSFLGNVVSSFFGSGLFIIALMMFAAWSSRQVRHSIMDDEERCGTAELWFVSGQRSDGDRWFTNRLVIANMHSGRTLRDLRWRASWRRIMRRTQSELTFIDDPIVGGSGETIILPGSKRGDLFGGEDQVVFSFRILRDQTGRFSICFTNKFGDELDPRAVVSDIRDVHLHYRFRRPSSLIGLFKHDVTCWYLFPFHDSSLIEMMWKAQNKLNSEHKEEAKYDLAIPIIADTDVSTTV